MTQREQIKTAAFRFIARQILVVVFTGLVAGIVFNRASAYGILVGGLLCGVLPSLLATMIVYVKQSYQSAGRMLLRFFIAELLKIGLCASLFIISFKCIPGLNLYALFIGLVIALFTVWLSPFRHQPHQSIVGAKHHAS